MPLYLAAPVAIGSPAPRASKSPTKAAADWNKIRKDWSAAATAAKRRMIPVADRAALSKKWNAARASVKAKGVQGLY